MLFPSTECRLLSQFTFQTILLNLWSIFCTQNVDNSLRTINCQATSVFVNQNFKMEKIYVTRHISVIKNRLYVINVLGPIWKLILSAKCMYISGQAFSVSCQVRIWRMISRAKILLIWGIFLKVPVMPRRGTILKFITLPAWGVIYRAMIVPTFGIIFKPVVLKMMGGGGGFCTHAYLQCLGYATYF
jgi:hypothetical protein